MTSGWLAYPWRLGAVLSRLPTRVVVHSNVGRWESWPLADGAAATRSAHDNRSSCRACQQAGNLRLQMTDQRAKSRQLTKILVIAEPDGSCRRFFLHADTSKTREPIGQSQGQDGHADPLLACSRLDFPAIASEDYLRLRHMLDEPSHIGQILEGRIHSDETSLRKAPGRSSEEAIVELDEPPGHDVAACKWGQSEGQIRLTPCQVIESTIRQQLNLDPRMKKAKGCCRRGNQMGTEPVRRGDAQQSCDRVRVTQQMTLKRQGLRLHRLGCRQHPEPFFRQYQAPMRTLKQSCVRGLFQGCHPPTRSRLRNAQLACSAA